jgi:hypothetical protein
LCKALPLHKKICDCIVFGSVKRPRELRELKRAGVA